MSVVSFYYCERQQKGCEEMSSLMISLPDGANKEVEQGTTIKTLAGLISRGLKKKAIAGKINGKIVDLNTFVEDGDMVEVITLDSPAGLEILRHSTAHLMAQAIKRLYGNVKLGVGPVIENGFYYDMDLPVSLTPDDLENIEKEMEKITNENLDITRVVVTKEEALSMYSNLNDHLKLELISKLPEGEEITIYQQGEFFDLCRGPHVPSTGKLRAIKLQSIAGAYWRGDSDRQMLQRVYGTAWAKKEQLGEYLQFLEEAKKRDHRRLGKDLNLFSFSEEAPGMPLYLPNGMVLRNELESLWREEHQKANYEEIRTPIIMNRRLWERSGHWDHYHENMYFTKIDQEDFAVKPMNCPGAMLVYKNDLHSYRNLPIRFGELGLVHRHELSGSLNGLLRVRTFTQDDAHIFVRPDQIREEIHAIIDLIDRFYSLFGFSYSVELSTRPEKSMGSDELWEKAIDDLRTVLDERGMDYVINEGDGAFYGPKIDFHVSDAIKRTWQCGTIQLDFQMPEKFDCTYIGKDKQKHTPVVIHRVVYGSLERFMAVLIEHYAGAFPTWLAPVQVKVLPIAEAHVEYAQRVAEQLKEHRIRVEVDQRKEKMGYKIREAQLQKIPYMLVIGDKEMESNIVAIRKRREGDVGVKPIAEVIEIIVYEIKERR
jgi:threonyl-tRNA synthetase